MAFGWTDEIRFAVRIQNEEKLKQLNADLKAQADHIRQLNAAYQGVSGGQQMFLAAAAAPASRIRRITEEMEKLKQSMGQGGQGGFGRGGMGLMLLSQTIDDMQYGFRAIVNNVPMVGMAIGQAFGMGTESAMKFGGALGIAAVGVNTWLNNWEHVKKAFGDTGVFKAAEAAILKVNELLAGGAANQRANDMKDRAKQEAEDRRKGAESDRKAAEGTRSKRERQVAEDFAEAKGEYEKDDKGRLRREMIEQQVAGNPAMQKELRDMRAGIVPRGQAAEERRELLREKIDSVDIAIGEGMRGNVGLQGGREFGKEMKRRLDNAEIDRLNDQSRGDEENVMNRRSEERARLARELIRGGFANKYLGSRDTGKQLQEQLDEMPNARGMGHRFKAPEMIKEMRQQLEEQIEKVMADKGVDRDTAKRVILADQQAPERQMRRRVKGILEGARPEKSRAEFQSFDQAWKAQVMGGLNGKQDIQERQLKALEELVKLVQDNPAMANQIAGMAGIPALAAN